MRSNKTKPKPSNICQKTRMGPLSRFSNFIHNLSKSITGLMIFTAIIVVIVLGYRNFKTYSVIIKAFNVPSVIESQGYNGKVMANKLIDQMNGIRMHDQKIQDTDDPVASFPGDNESMKIPGAGVGISFDYILQQIGKVFGCKTIVITNDAFIENNELKVTTRVNNSSVETFSRYESEDLDSFLLRIAEYVSKYTQPVQLAAYHYAANNYDDALLIIQHVLGNESKDDDSLAYVIWGDILLERDNDQNGAIEKYKEAIKLDIKNYQAYNNWGNTLYKQERYKEAIVKYEKANELAPQKIAPSLNLGLAYEKEGDFDKAIEQYTGLMENIVKAPLSVFLNLARTYTTKGEKEKAVEVLTEAVEKDESLKEEIQEEQEFKILENVPSFQEIIK